MEKKFIKKPNYAEEIVMVIRANLNNKDIDKLLLNYHEKDIADAFLLLTIEERRLLYNILGAENISEFFSYIDVDDAQKYISELEIEHAAEIIENLDSDDAVDILDEIDDEIEEKIVSLIDDESSRDIELIRSYSEDEVGNMMTTNFVKITKNVSVKQAMRSLISQADENDNISTIYVCDEDDRLYGVIDLKDLIIARDYIDLETIISKSYPYLRDDELISNCLETIKDYGEDSLPVLDCDDKILGVITSQDVIEAVDDEMGEDYAKLAGLTSEEDLNEPIVTSMRKRLPWLSILLILGMAVSSIVGIFEGVVAQIAIIACFQPLVLGMAGNAGTQSLAVTIRVLMDEDVGVKEKFHLVFKELKIGLFNGLILGILGVIIIGIYTIAIKKQTILYAFAVSGCVGLSLILSILIASLVGTIVPIFFHKIKIDPAVASGPLITTINDMVAVISYYGLAGYLLIGVLHLV